MVRTETKLKVASCPPNLFFCNRKLARLYLRSYSKIQTKKYGMRECRSYHPRRRYAFPSPAGHGRNCDRTSGDSGPGIPESDRARVFQPYWQAPATADLGAGLGLTITKKIV